MKNHSDEVSQRPTSDVNTSPPKTGSAQPGMPRRLSTSIFTVNAPKKKQPSSEWTSTRGEWDSNPSA